MKRLSKVLAGVVLIASAGYTIAQAPVLSLVQAPYEALQNTQPIHLAGNSYSAGQVAYGPVGTPLNLTGASFGDNGEVWFVSYKNGANDSQNSPPVRAAVSLWSATSISVTVPSGAKSGLIEVISGDKESNGLPFLVTTGTYSASCTLPTQQPLKILTSSLSDGSVSHSYSTTLQLSGGTASYTWSLASGSLPTGLSLSSSGVISGTPSAATSPVSFTVKVTDSSSPSQYDTATLSMEVAAQPEASSSSALYSFSIKSSGGAEGYDPMGNVTAYTDSVNGTWTFAYDSLNRLAMGTGGQDDDPNPNYCWQYDGFGNRLSQYSASAAFSFGSGGAGSCTINGSVGSTFVATYNTNNQMQTTTQNPNQSQGYDTAGNITNDGINSYLYDAEGRICAVQQSVSGITTLTGYLYNAEGQRVAKGSLTQFTCDANPSDTTTYNGFAATNIYIQGPSGDQMTELGNNAGSGANPVWTWAHTNVNAEGLSATYDADLTGQTDGKIYFHLADWLGTRRQQTDYAGNPVLNFTGLPYGDGLSIIPVSSTNAADAMENHFTGKERDAESGNDYFGARYYASSTGRFLSPDWSAKEDPTPYANLDDPQTLNLYAYVQNNPVAALDSDGHEGMAVETDTGFENITAFQRDAISEGRSQADGTAAFESAWSSPGGSAAVTGTSHTTDGSKAQHPISMDRLTTILYHEMGSLSPDPDSEPGEAGSAEDLHNGRVAVGEVILTRFRTGHHRIGKDIASDKLSSDEKRAMKNKVPGVVSAFADTRTAAQVAYNGSNTMNGAQQYRTRYNGDIAGNLGRTRSNPGTPLSAHFGPFINSTGGTAVEVIAP